MLQGYRIVTGQSRESMMHLVTNMARIALIVTAATTMAVSGANLHDWLTIGLDKEVHQLYGVGTASLRPRKPAFHFE